MARKDSKNKTVQDAGAARGGHTDKLAAGIDPAARAANILQLRRARGQVDGIERMLQDDRACAEIIVQIIAARASLQVVANSLLEAHLRACHAAAAGNGGAAVDKMYQELVGLVAKMSR